MRRIFPKRVDLYVVSAGGIWGGRQYCVDLHIAPVAPAARSRANSKVRRTIARIRAADADSDGAWRWAEVCTVDLHGKRPAYCCRGVLDYSWVVYQRRGVVYIYCVR